MDNELRYSQNGCRKSVAFIREFISCHSGEKSKKTVDADNLRFGGGGKSDGMKKKKIHYRQSHEPRMYV